MIKAMTILILKLIAWTYIIATFILPIRHRRDWASVKRGMKYPQTWNLWYRIFPRWTHRGTEHIKNVKNDKCLQIIHSLCSLLTGHEISKTEKGYGGGNMIDYNCRWCDQLIQIPMSEQPKDGKFLTDLFNTTPGPGPASEFGQDKL